MSFFCFSLWLITQSLSAYPVAYCLSDSTVQAEKLIKLRKQNQRPASIQYLSGVQYTFHQVKLFITDTTSLGKAAYHIERSLDGAAFTKIKTIPSDQKSYIDDVPAGTQKIGYRVLSETTMGISTYSKIIEVIMELEVKDLEISSNCTSHPWYETRWLVKNPNRFYVTLFWEIPLTDQKDSIGLLIGNNNVFVPKLSGRNQYKFSWRINDDSLKSINVQGSNQYCEIEYMPKKITSFKVASFSTDHIELTWEKNLVNAHYYKIERSINGGAFQEIKKLENSYESYLDKALEENTTYTYRIRITNHVSHSLYSDPVTVKTKVYD